MSSPQARFCREMSYISTSETDTQRIGNRLAGVLSSGDVVALQGPLGAGKTRLVQAIATAFGCEQSFIVSPTFTLIHEYNGRLPVYHVDAYRLKNADEFLDLGGGELLSGSGVCLIEWADRIGEVLPFDHLRIDFHVHGPETRELVFRSSGPSSALMLDQMSQENH